MGQTSTDAKREVDQTREHLGETLDALQLRAKRNLDLKTQLQTNPVVQLSIGALVIAIAGLALYGFQRRSRRSTAERLVRKLKLNDLREHLNDFGDDARAWAAAQKRIGKADGKGKKVAVEHQGGIARRLIVSAAEAALTAIAAGYAKRLVSGAATPHEKGHAAVSKQR
ncbi:MAG: DUF3618 domain-containing protein [Candidatus Dormibacteraeota bacterium]|nr:DUF3618 domain-containing protein [Candidatus Dormibacteraeota bacterium]